MPETLTACPQCIELAARRTTPHGESYVSCDHCLAITFDGDELDDDPPPLAYRSITVGYDGEQCDLISIAAQVLLPLAHLRPQLNRGGTYLLLTDMTTIPAPTGDHAIVCNLIDRLNEVAAQLPTWPTSISAWMHVGGEIYQVARNKDIASPGG